MRVVKFAGILLALSVWSTVAAASRQGRDVRGLSMRWAQNYAVRCGVPPDLVMAIIDVESGWNPYAVSDKGAVGLMQLMPRTAARFGVRNRFLWNENIRGGVEYLAWLNREFSGDLRLIAAAYHVGEGPIHLRQLDYSSATVQGYVRRVAERYRARRRCVVNFQTANNARR